MYKLSAVFVGGIISIMLFCNGELSVRLGNYNAVVMIHLTGLFVIGLILIIKSKKLAFNKSIPVYLYSAGAVGVIMIIFNNLCMNSLGVSMWAYLGGALGVIVVSISSVIIPKIPTIYSTLLIFTGQLFFGILLDFYRDGLISKGKMIGGSLILIGMLYNFYVDKISAQAKTIEI